MTGVCTASVFIKEKSLTHTPGIHALLPDTLACSLRSETSMSSILLVCIAGLQGGQTPFNVLTDLFISSSEIPLKGWGRWLSQQNAFPCKHEDPSLGPRPTF